MDGVLKLASAVVTPAVRWWLAERQKASERSLQLTNLIDIKPIDNFRKRELRREVEALADVVAERLTPLLEAEFGDTHEEERLAVLNAVVETFTSTNLDDEALFLADMRPEAIARQLRESATIYGDTLSFSDDASRLFDILLSECCTCYVRLVQQLAPFQPRAITEILGRVSGLAAQYNSLLERVPARTLDAPVGADLDEDFRERYISALGEELDTLDVIGIETPKLRSKTSVSIAYVSLSASTTAERHQRIDKLRQFEPGAFTWAAEDQESPGLRRIERVISGATRIMIRGEAGSGKTTLLRWLAVTACRERWTPVLSKWRGSVPFFVKLRSYSGEKLPRPSQFIENTTDMLIDIMPEGWVHRQLLSGRGLLLIDGVDELTQTERPKVRQWLGKLVHQYPRVRIIVTTRPAAATADWLGDEGFASAILDRMTASDVRRFIAHWHDALRSAGGYPREERELPKLERALVGRLDANVHLANLSTNPLLCGMLCALNLERASQLPRDRIGLYRDALELLIERREAMRKIPAFSDLVLETSDKVHLLRDLAWRMSVNGRSEETRTRAERRIAQKLTTMPDSSIDATTTLSYLVQRSGVLREPVEGKVDFVHRTFQEYLTAVECAEQGDVEFLSERAHLDQWRDVIVMAVGLGNRPFRLDLLDKLHLRAKKELKYARQIRLVIASCFETLRVPEEELIPIRDEATNALVPPRSLKEASSLASVGSSLLRKLPSDLSSLTEAQAAAVIRTIALVNGPDALTALARHGSDPRERVQEQLVTAWRYFDPQRYAQQVLADSPLRRGTLRLTDQRLVPHTKYLNHLVRLIVDVGSARSLSWLEEARNLHSLTVRGDFTDITPILDHPSLISLEIDTVARLTDTSPVWSLDGPTEFSLFDLDTLVDVDRLGEWPDLETLGLSGVNTDYLGSVLKQLPALFGLQLKNSSDFSPKNFRNVGLVHLSVEGTEIVGSFRALSTYLVDLSNVSLYQTELADLSGLEQMVGLTDMTLAGVPISDLRPLESLPKLHTLFMWDCERITDFSPLLGVEKLKELYIPDMSNYAPPSGIQGIESKVFVEAWEVPIYAEAGIKTIAW